MGDNEHYLGRTRHLSNSYEYVNYNKLLALLVFISAFIISNAQTNASDEVRKVILDNYVNRVFNALDANAMRIFL